MSLLVDLQKILSEITVENNNPFPIRLSEGDAERIKRDRICAIAGTKLDTKTQRALGDLWPEKGIREGENYNETKAVLGIAKAKMLEVMAQREKQRNDIFLVIRRLKLS